MSDNTERFTGRAEEYDRYRQRYPSEEVLALLQTWCGLEPNWIVADIGAGTGMFAEVFLENRNPVLAIEPNADMRDKMHAAFHHRGSRSTHPEIIDATAESTTLPDTSVDMVAAGRAFHWFDKERALTEFRRILKPGGWVALVSLGRAHDTSEQTSAFEHLLMEHGTDYKYVRSGYRVHDNMQELFGPNAEIHQTKIAGTQTLDWETFRGQTLSLSVVPQLDHPNYEAFQRELRNHFAMFAVDGILAMPTICWVTAARLNTR